MTTIGLTTNATSPTPQVEALGNASAKSTASDASKAKAQAEAVAAARQALAVANSAVETDQRNHSPSCVACDEKLVDKAEVQLAAAKGTVSPSGDLLDATF